MKLVEMQRALDASWFVLDFDPLRAGVDVRTRCGRRIGWLATWDALCIQTPAQLESVLAQLHLESDVAFREPEQLRMLG